MEKSNPKIRGHFSVFFKPPKVNTRPISENPPNLVTLFEEWHQGNVGQRASLHTGHLEFQETKNNPDPIQSNPTDFL
jgi:hypothetical protein